ncbi:MAG: cytidylate kinase-like family protein [Anaerovoracaceae bacterium]
MIITIGRAFGSGGHEIGKRLAEDLGLEFFDKVRLMQIAKDRGEVDSSEGFYSEKPLNSLLCAVSASSCCDKKKNKAFKMLESIGNKGNCVIIGRCSNVILRGNKEAVHIFITGDEEKRIKRIEEEYILKDKDAKRFMEETDEKRRDFHEHYTDEQWGHGQNYNLTIDSLSIGIENTVELIKNYIKMRKI